MCRQCTKYVFLFKLETPASCLLVLHDDKMTSENQESVPPPIHLAEVKVFQMFQVRLYAEPHPALSSGW